MRIATLLVLLALPSLAAGQTGRALRPTASPEGLGISTPRLGRIDAMLNDLVAKQKMPGAVVYIARNGHVAYYKAFGYRDVATQAPLRKDDIFRIASQSKAITSLAVMMLCEEGKFGLDDPVSRYIPEFAKTVRRDDPLQPGRPHAGVRIGRRKRAPVPPRRARYSSSGAIPSGH